MYFYASSLWDLCLRRLSPCASDPLGRRAGRRSQPIPAKVPKGERSSILEEECSPKGALRKDGIQGKNAVKPAIFYTFPFPTLAVCFLPFALLCLAKQRSPFLAEPTNVVVLKKRCFFKNCSAAKGK